jgi:hypothetical protein
VPRHADGAAPAKNYRKEKVSDMSFACNICGEESTRICSRCTKDSCENHLCDRCVKCSDCCECEVHLSEAAPVVRVAAAVLVEETMELGEAAEI